MSERRNEQCALIDGIQEDINLQYAAVLMLIQKSDYRNFELQNQISIVQSQLSNLTAIELQNRNFSMSKHIVSLFSYLFYLFLLVRFMVDIHFCAEWTYWTPNHSYKFITWHFCTTTIPPKTVGWSVEGGWKIPVICGGYL